jgi:hypothetical protein
MKGTTPKVRPLAAWANTEKQGITIMESHNVLILPRNTHNKPSTICTTHNLPLIPNLFTISLEITTPIGLEKQLFIPKQATTIPVN